MLGVAGLCMAAGAALLAEPLGRPVFTKFALFHVDERPPGDPGRGPDALPRPSLAQASGFLGPGAEWPAIVAGAARVFPQPRYDGRGLEPAADPGHLFEAISRGEGMCSDWTETLISLCQEARRRCREWAHIAYPDAPDTGHAVVDVWLPDPGRWALLDTYAGFWARGADGEPLSALALERALLAGGDGVVVEPLRPGGGRADDVRQYYRDPDARLVEMVRNRPRAVADHWSRDLERWSKPAGQLLQGVLGLAPLYLVPDDEHHATLRRHLARFRRKLVAGCAVTGLGLALGVAAFARPRAGH